MDAIVSPWQNDAVIDRLKASWQYYSASQIAKILSEEFGMPFTRNGVIGKIHRLGLTGGEKKPHDVLRPKRPKSGAPRRNRPRNKIIPDGSGGYRMMQSIETDMEPLREVEVIPLNLTLQELENESCRYVVCDKQWLFCGHEKLADYPYCPQHTQLCYIPQNQRKRSTVPAWR